MQISTALFSGFCEGVERASRIAVDAAKKGKPVYMLGNLVHNKLVVERLNSLGVKSISDISSIPPEKDTILLISAHGVSPDIYEQAKARGLAVIDTTCPWVKKAQKIARELAEEGRRIIIVGDKGHPEVKGLIGWSQGKAIVIENIQQLDQISLLPEEKVGVLAQTTQAEDHFTTISAQIKNRFRDVKIHDTICDATTKRQAAAADLARKVELMLVIGDNLSANTKRLAEICSSTGTRTYQIETADEIHPDWLKGIEKIGITAGASTPEWAVKEVITCLSSI